MALWKDKTRGGWRYSFQHLGVKYFSKRFKTRNEAETARAEAKRKLQDLEKSGVGKPTQDGMDFRVVASLYLDFSSKRHAKQTFEYKRFVYRLFAQEYGTTLVEDITPQHIITYLSTRPSNYNYNVHRKELHCLFHFAKKVLKVIQHNPCEDVPRLPHSPQRKVIPTEQHIQKLLNTAEGEEKEFLLVMLLTLGRIDEILRLKWEDINFEQRTILLWTRKRKQGALEADPIPMNDVLYEVLRNKEKHKVDSTDYVFINQKTGTRYGARNKFMRGLCKRAGIPKIGFHNLRHYMASLLADKKNISKLTISKLLRHKNLGTTEIYLHSIGEGQRSAMDEVNGLFASLNIEKVGAGGGRRSEAN